MSVADELATYQWWGVFAEPFERQAPRAVFPSFESAQGWTVTNFGSGWGDAFQIVPVTVRFSFVCTACSGAGEVPGGAT